LFKCYNKVMVFNVTFNSISVRSWRSVLLLEETAENCKANKFCKLEEMPF
jgi:hypothetical protein